MQLHMADGCLPADSPAKTLLSRVLNLMARGIVEARAALEGLRSSEVPVTNLEKALSDFKNELASDQRAK